MKAGFLVPVRFPVLGPWFCPTLARGLGSSEFCETLSEESHNLLSDNWLSILNRALHGAHFPCRVLTFHKTRAYDETARTHSAGASVCAPAVGEALSVLARMATAYGADRSSTGRSSQPAEGADLSATQAHEVPTGSAHLAWGQSADRERERQPGQNHSFGPSRTSKMLEPYFWDC